jgi:hypothetical protein
MLFPDDRLTLLEVTEDVPDSLTYLVWRREGREPEVWSYLGMQSHEFANLEEYFKWQLR